MTFIDVIRNYASVRVPLQLFAEVRCVVNIWWLARVVLQHSCGGHLFIVLHQQSKQQQTLSVTDQGRTRAFMHFKRSHNNNRQMQYNDRMERRALHTEEQVLRLLDPDGEDEGMEDTFFPGSDEEFELNEDDTGR